jgi:hypothetical protein
MANFHSMIRFLKVFIILLFISGAPAVSVCMAQDNAAHKVPSNGKRNSKAAKEKRRKDKEIKKAEEYARNQHLNIQDKKTRNRMKKNRKMTTAKHDHKKELFLKRWFTRKP